MPPPKRAAPGTAPATDGEALRSHLFGIRWPLLFQASNTPPARAVVPYDQTTTPTRFTWRIILGAKKFTLPAAVLLGISQVAGALLPVAAGTTVDRAIATQDTGELILWCFIVISAVLVSSLATRFGSRCGQYGMQAVQHRLRMTVTDRLLHPAGMKGRQLGGADLSIATGDVFRVAFTMQLGVYPVGELVAIVAGGVILLTIAWPLGSAVLVGAPLMLWVMTLAGRPMQRRSKEQQARVAAATGQASDLITGYRTIKGLRAEEISTDRYTRVSQDALEGALTVQNSRGLYFGSMNVVSGVFIAGLTVAATAMAIQGALSIGDLIAVIGVTQFMMNPLTNLPRSVGSIWASGVVSAGRVLDLLKTPYADDRRDTGSALDEKVKRLSEKPLGLRSQGFRAAPGELLGIRAGGADARDLVDTLASGARGVTLISGARTVPAETLPVDTYRRYVLASPHNADIFDGTIADNIVPTAAPGGMSDRALYAASCTDIVDGLPAGVDTRVGESGTRLSGGQRQRIALARALAVDAPILVLHDPTTAVDAITEHTIASRLAAVREGRTTVVVSGSATLLAACDRVIDMEGAHG